MRAMVASTTLTDSFRARPEDRKRFVTNDAMKVKRLEEKTTLETLFFDMLAKRTYPHMKRPLGRLEKIESILTQRERPYHIP